MYLQTGDVIYELSDKVFKDGLKEIQGNLVHKGDNHHHRIEGEFALFEDGGEFYILAKDICNLTHEEHKTIQLPAGLYRKKIVLEYDHFLEESREVID